MLRINGDFTASTRWHLHGQTPAVLHPAKEPLGTLEVKFSLACPAGGVRPPEAAEPPAVAPLVLPPRAIHPPLPARRLSQNRSFLWASTTHVDESGINPSLDEIQLPRSISSPRGEAASTPSGPPTRPATPSFPTHQKKFGKGKISKGKDWNRDDSGFSQRNIINTAPGHPAFPGIFLAQLETRPLGGP